MAGNSKRAQLFHKLTPLQLDYVIRGLDRIWAAEFDRDGANLEEIRPLFRLLEQVKRERDERPKES